MSLLENKLVATAVAQSSAATQQTNTQKAIAFLGNHKREIAVIATGVAGAAMIGVACSPVVSLAAAVALIALGCVAFVAVGIDLASPNPNNSLSEKAQKGNLEELNFEGNEPSLETPVCVLRPARREQPVAEPRSEANSEVSSLDDIPNLQPLKSNTATPYDELEQRMIEQTAPTPTDEPTASDTLTEPTASDTLNAAVKVFNPEPTVVQPYKPLTKVALGTVGVATLVGIGCAGYSGIQNHNLAVAAAAKAQTAAQRVPIAAGILGYTDAAQTASAYANSWESYTPSMPGMPDISGLTGQLPSAAALKESVLSAMPSIPIINYIANQFI